MKNYIFDIWYIRNCDTTQLENLYILIYKERISKKIYKKKINNNNKIYFIIIEEWKNK